MSTHAVPQPKIHRIRASLGRLSSLEDVIEMRYIAKANARSAASAGDRTREAFCLAVVRETDATFEAVRCQVEPPHWAAAI
jgi:hypothetical protein